jgi:hypothetical protein
MRTARGVQVRQVWQIRPDLHDIGQNAIRAGLSPAKDRISLRINDISIDGANYLFEALLEPRPAGAVRITQIDVSFYVPGFGDMEVHDELVLEFSQNLAVTSRLEGYVMDVVQKAQSLKLQTQALKDAESGEIETAIQKLRQVVPVLMSQGEILLAAQMRREVDQLEKFGQLSAEGRKTIRLAYRER